MKYFQKLERVKKKLDDCLRYIEKEKPKSSDFKMIACMVILEDDLQALIQELKIYTEGFLAPTNIIDSFLERCATVIEEVVSLEYRQERPMVIQPFSVVIKNYSNHSSRHH